MTALSQTVLSDQDLAQVIAHYKKLEIQALEMPPAVRDPKFRAGIHKQLPPYKRINDQKVLDNLWRVLEPVLTFSGRSNVYEILIVDSLTPLMMSDSGVVLVISIGMIQRAESDDELLGYAAQRSSMSTLQDTLSTQTFVRANNNRRQ